MFCCDDDDDDSSGGGGGVRGFPTFFTCPSVLCHPAQSAWARESYHVNLTSYIPVNTTARRTEGNTRKEAGRKAFNSKREKWNGSIHGVNTATKIGKGMPASLLYAVKLCIFNFLHSAEFDSKTNRNIYCGTRLYLRNSSLQTFIESLGEGGFYSPWWANHIRQDSYGLSDCPSHRPLPDGTQLSKETDTHAAGEIRTHNPSKPAAADPRMKPCGHWAAYTVMLLLITL
jgi:hypothetical protein